jgi:phage-related tail fiber protein
MALDFPNNPSLNQVFTSPSGKRWRWNGVKWGGFGGAEPVLSLSAINTPTVNLNYNTDTKILSASTSITPVGSVMAFPSINAPSGWLKLNGASLNRSDYPDLWAFAQSSGNLVTDTVWYTTSAIGSFSEGNGSTTFRIPDFRGEFVRGWDDSRGVDTGRGIGTTQGDAIRNITGSLSGVLGVTNQAYTWGFRPGSNGAFSVAYSMAPYNQYSGPYNPPGGSGSVANFNASDVVPTAQENRPRNVSLLYCIKF